MTFRVALACSDHTLDQYVLVPVYELLMKSLGKPHARVFPIRNPRLRGDAEYFSRACEILERYGPVADVVIYTVDVDGKPERVEGMRTRLDNCNSPYRDKAIIVGAVNEAEVWALWGSRQVLPDWAQVRAEPHPKETYFNGLMQAGDEFSVDKGRIRLTTASVSLGWESLKKGCPELAVLEEEIQRILKTG